MALQEQERRTGASQLVRAIGALPARARVAHVADRVGPWVPAVLIGLAALTLLWTRLIGLDQSFFDDELFSVTKYITPGVSAIYGTYVPNDHILFELLTRATVQITGTHSNAGYRFWSVLPAIGAIAAMTWWLWRRRDAWTAAAFAVLAVAAPVHLMYGTQARGYGLGFLAGVMVVIGALEYREERETRWLAVTVAGSLIGIWTLPVFALYVLGALGPLLWFRELRRPLLIVLIGVGAASLVFYAPVLGGIISNSSQKFGARLPWDGFIRGPLLDQLAPSIQLLFPHASQRELEVATLALLGAGVIGLWRRWERVMAVMFVGAAVLTYLVLELARFYVEARFACYVLLPMLAVIAVGLVEIGRLVARLPVGGVIAVVIAVLLSLLLLSKIERVGNYDAAVPEENTEQAARILAGTGFTEPIVTNSQRSIGFRYYLGGSNHFQILTIPALQRMFCSSRSAFIYLEHGLHSPLADTSCLTRRHSVRVVIPQRDEAVLAIWFVPSE